MNNIRKCKYCNNNINNYKNSQYFCNIQCRDRFRNIHMIMHKCKRCKKLTINNKYCSRMCACRINCYTGGKAAAIVNRKNGTSMFFDKKIQSRGGKNCQLILQKNNLSCFYNKEQHRISCSKGGIISCKTLHKKFPYIAKNFALAAAQRFAKNSKYKWYGIGFFSKSEMQCAKQLLKRPKFGYNCHVSVGTKTIDFYPQKEDKMFQGIFVEYHPIIKFLRHDETIIKYYNARRKVLDENGYKDKKLIVIKSLKELENYKCKI